MKRWLMLLLGFALGLGSGMSAESTESSPTEAKARPKVFILPIRDDISTPMVYLVRRGVKEAMEANADLLVLDMNTDGGLASATLEIMEILAKFPNKTATYVNRKAFSAGAFIAVATQKIYMAPQSVIGAAAPIMMAPGGAGVEEMPSTVEAKMTSALRALIRTAAEKNGHDVEVIEAMIDKTKELRKDGKVLCEKGEILTLTDIEAAREYGDPPKPLLSAGTMETIDDVIQALGYSNAVRHYIQPTGAERIGGWLNAISPILLLIGIVGIYIEIKTPGFGLPGIVGVLAFLLYFLGGYIAGFSGLEWMLVFALGVALLAVELFVYQGTLFIGLLGGALIIVALIMALVDIYPQGPGMPDIPTFTWANFQRPIETLVWGLLGAIVAIALLSRVLPKTEIYRIMVSQGAAAMQTEAAIARHQQSLEGQIGVAISPLHPGGKAQFGDRIVDVVTEGDLLPKGAKVKVVGYSGRDPVVVPVEE